MGVDMPRTPAVFPPKRKWSLREQVEWGGDSDFAAAYRGATRRNYSSAVGFAKEVEKALRKQAAKGQLLVLPEAEARARYGDRLTIASLSALEKGTDEDGETEVRVLHDGTHGVDTNKYIKVLDGGLSPIARDMKTSMRMQAARGTPHCGVTVDVEGAHKVIVVRPEDWPLQACQIVPGGDVFLNTRGTFGIASAAYWWGRLAAALTRSGLLVLGLWLPFWAFLFADDYDLTAEG